MTGRQTDRLCDRQTRIELRYTLPSASELSVPLLTLYLLETEIGESDREKWKGGRMGTERRSWWGGGGGGVE